MLTISVKNFGPIAEGSVDLKPLTIFVGPSNTGKSYMATAVYVLMKAFQGRNLSPPRRITPRTPWWERLGYSAESSWTDGWVLPMDDSEVGEAIYEWARRLKNEGEPGAVYVSDLPEIAREHIYQSISEVLYWLRQDVKGQFAQSLGEPLYRIGFPEDLQVTVRRNDPFLDIQFLRANDETAVADCDISMSEIEPSPLVLSEISGIVRDGWDPIEVPEVFIWWFESIERTINSGIPANSFYLPAARTGIALAYKTIAAELVRQSPRHGDQQTYFPRLPGVTTEFLGNLITLDQNRRNQRIAPEIENAIGLIEGNVLRGEISFDSTAGLLSPEIVYLPASQGVTIGKFTLNQTSSMVSELAPLVLFLKYLINSGDLLILEEPESHLHPAAQRQLARGIVRLVNAGVKVLITTHSETFVSQINHLLRISYASKRWLKEHNFEPEDCITHDQVGAYQFAWDEEQGGSVVKPLEVHKDIGIDEAEFIGVIDSLYEESLLVQRIRVKE